MSSRLSVIFYIILCLEIGLVLTVLPWCPMVGWVSVIGAIIIFSCSQRTRPVMVCSDS